MITFPLGAANIALLWSAVHPSGPRGMILIFFLRCLALLLLLPVRLSVNLGAVYGHRGTRKAYTREGRRSCMLRFLPEVGVFG